MDVRAVELLSPLERGVSKKIGSQWAGDKNGQFRQ